jgi:hypothetical protein
LAGGTTVKASFAGVPPLTEIAELDFAVIKLFVESDAMRMQLPVWLIVTALKVATPATSACDVLPPSAQDELRPTVSAVSVPEVTTLLNWSSLETLNVVNATLAPAVAGGAVVKAN